MASWQHYPGAPLGPPGASWAPEAGANNRVAGRSRASAPPPFDEEEKRDVDGAFGDQVPGFGRAPQQNFAPNYTPQYQEQPHSQQGNGGFLRGYAGYPTGFDGQQWRQGPIPQQSTAVRGDWVSLNGPWTGGSAAPSIGYRGLRLHERRGRRTPGFLIETLRLCVFHIVNVFFAMMASGVLSAGMCAAASLIPVCCVGLLIFQVLVYIVFALAQWDITLGNYIAPAHQCAYPSLPPYGRVISREGFSGYHIAPGLAYFSPLSLMAMLYFVLVKPVIGCLSLLAVLLVVAPAVSLITSLSTHYHGDYNSFEIYGVNAMTLSRYPGLSLVGAICVMLVGVALMQLVAKISLGATRFFCCEKFSVTSRFARASPYQQYQPLAQHRYGMASYGSTSASSRA